MRRLHAGFTLGDRYRLRERLASGGMGEVWLADDDRLRRPVAVKITHPHSGLQEAVVQRFREEAIIGARLSHPHIVAVHDYGGHDDLTYLVMEYVAGRTLAQLLRDDGPLDPVRLRGLLWQVASALGAAHQAGIVHRDIKPANILVSGDGTAKITDFGIAKDDRGKGLTLTGEVLGTPHYLSPEQALGRPATAASDIYAVGVVAHELLTGVKPFDAETPMATVLAHAHQEPPRLPSSTPADLAAVINDCLAKEARRRPTNGAVLADRLAPHAPVPSVNRAAPQLSSPPQRTVDGAGQAPFQSPPATAVAAATPPPTLREASTLPAEQPAPTTAPARPAGAARTGLGWPAYAAAGLVFAFFIVLIQLAGH